ncbi:MAG: hypothetical protein ACTHL8_19980 [Burkholderiaceae bacterium]
MKLSSQVAAGLVVVGLAASGVAFGGPASASASAAGPAASAAKADAEGCAAASAPVSRRTSKVRHVPAEDDPCAGTSGVAPTKGALPEPLRAARRAAAASAATR